MRFRAGRGFGLVELMIAMTIGVLLVLGVAQVFLAGRESFALQQKNAALQENARFVLSRISRDLRQVGMFGCLDLTRLPATTQDQLPVEFSAPLSFVDGVLRLVTAVPKYEATQSSGNLSAAQYGAKWLLVSDCLSRLEIAEGTDVLAVQPTDMVIAVRQIEYRTDQHRLQTRLNGRGNFEVLIDDVESFELDFGLVGSADSEALVGGYQSTITPEQFTKVRSVRVLLSLSDQPSEPSAGRVKAQEYTLVTALRNRLE